jgi:hypothetical protein
MGKALIIIFDLIAAVAVIGIAVILYRKFVAPSPTRDKVREIAYEEGFSDAVRYFGLKKLYSDDPMLTQRMNEVFREVGVPHKFSDLLQSLEQDNQKDPRLRDSGKKVPR